MRLLLARHGETDWNVASKIQGSTDTELNEVGKEQARQLGQKLVMERIQIDTIYTSKLKRAALTAQIIGEMMGVDVEPVDGLEEINLGQWEGMRWSEVRNTYPDEYEEWYHNRRYYKVPNGESYQDLLVRDLSVLKNIINEKINTALVVTHSANIVTLLAAINKVAFEDMFKKYKIENTSVIELDSKDIKNLDITV